MIAFFSFLSKGGRKGKKKKKKASWVLFKF